MAGGGLAWLAKWLASAMGGGERDEKMTAERAIMYPPVWHCVSKITGAFMIMPLNVHRQSGRNKSIQDKHPAYKLMRWRPNAYQTPAQWKRQMMCHALLWGNARSYIRRENGVPVELIPLLPDRTATKVIDGEKWHGTIVEKDDALAPSGMGETEKKTLYFPDSEVWHVPGLGFDGVEGVSLISIAAQSWNLGLGAEKHLTKIQKKGYGGGLMFEAPAGIFRKEDDAKEFLKAAREQFGGTDAEAIGLLREGIKANVLSMSNIDAQFIEQRRFQREDTALLFLLESILGDSSNASYSSLEQKNLAYRQNCLAPWTTAFEEESELKLLTESERNRGFYFKFNDGALLRTEKAQTMAFVSQGITARVLNPNEGREFFDLNPYEGGDEYANPAVTPGSPGKQQEQPPTPDKQDAANTRALHAMLSNLLSVEANRCRDAAKKPDKFGSWIESFYLSWEKKLADDLEAIGADRELATQHCVESKRRLLEACECQPEQLVESVAKCVESWPNRVHAMIEEICCVKG